MMRFVAATLAISVTAAYRATDRAERAEPAVEHFAVIVHPSTRTNDVSLTQLRRVFLGEQQFWPGGSRVILFVHGPGTTERAIVLRRLYEMSDGEFKRYWIAKTFRDDVTTGPKIVSSSALAKRLTASIPGAIAVIPASDVDASVKVLTIDSRYPGSPDYPLSGSGP